jgi:hypothetical protein
MKRIPGCHTFLANLIDVGKNFSSLCEIKTRSIINACGEKPDITRDTFLCIGPNIIPFGLNLLNANTTKLDGLPYWGTEPCACKEHDGELADFVAQGIKFDWVIAPDEWITYAENEEQQKQMLSLVSKIARKGFFTTIKDYKNMYANQRFFEEPFVLRTNTGDAITIRKREWDNQDRQAWDQHNYIIHNEELYICDVYRRRTMYFKQLAKFTSDLGATSFSVEKQNMYKPAFSKTFEYVVCIKF